MRYKLVGLVVLLLIATPVFSQEISPLIVETLFTTTPTAVKTAEPFNQTYVVKFLDLTASSETIEIDEKSLNPGMLGDFEILNLTIEKTVKKSQFLEHIWRLRYTLRIINPKKGTYKIPQIVIPWVRKRIGQDSNDPSIKRNYDFKTEEIYVTYVSTMTEDPYLDIRDEIDFGNFRKRATSLKILSLILAILPGLFWLTAFVKFLRSPSISNKTEEVEVENSGTLNKKEVSISRRRIKRNLYRIIKRFQSSNKDDYLEIEAELLVNLRNFLRGELHQLNIGHTPGEMIARINKLEDGRRKNNLLKLAEKAMIYQIDVEKGITTIENSLPESKDLKKILNQFRWYNRYLGSLIGLPGYLKVYFSTRLLRR